MSQETAMFNLGLLLPFGLYLFRVMVITWYELLRITWWCLHFKKILKLYLKLLPFPMNPNEISDHEIGLRGEYQSLWRLSYTGVQLDARRRPDPAIVAQIS